MYNYSAIIISTILLYIHLYSCDINLQDEKGKSSLHYAVFGNHSDIIKMLLSKGASVITKDSSNKTPLQYSIEMVGSCMQALLLGINDNRKEQQYTIQYRSVDKYCTYAL